MASSDRHTLTISTNLGPVAVEAPAGWTGESILETDYSPFGEWVIGAPEDRYALYIHTRLEPPDGKGSVERKIATMAIAVEFAHRMHYRDVLVSRDDADRGCVIRSSMAEDHEHGVWRHDERIRLIDAGERGLVTIRFILVGSADIWETDETTRLIVEFAHQFDLVTVQLMKQFGFDCATNPGLLWRETTLDMGWGDWTIRKPLGWSLTYLDGHDEGTRLWHGLSADECWDMNIERSLFPDEAGRAEQQRQNIVQRILATIRDIVRLSAAPIVETSGNTTIIEVLFRDTDYPLDLVRRWYIIKADEPRVALFRISFGCKSERVGSAAWEALQDFFRDMVDRTAMEPLAAHEPEQQT